ncbi:MAG: site-2 protease family protein [Caldisphaera sp.]
MQSSIEVLIGFLIFWGLLYFIVKLIKPKKVNIYPFLLIAKTGIKMDPISDKKKAYVISILGWISLFISIGLMGYFYYIVFDLFISRYIIQTSSSVSAGFVPLIPGVTIGLDQLTYFLLAIGIAVIVHELSHAIVARAEGIPIKDAGFFLLAFIPAAFVEPDENKIKSSSLRSRFKVYSAGVSVNLILGLIFLAIFLLITPKLFNGISIINVVSNSPASLAGIKPGMTVLSVNNTKFLSLQSFMTYLQGVGAESASTSVKLIFNVNYNGIVQNISIYKPIGVDHLGISVQQSFRLSWLISLISALYLINIGLALVNAAPLAIPLPGGNIQSDGGYIFVEALSKIGKKASMAGITFEVFTLLIILSLLTFSPIRLP